MSLGKYLTEAPAVLLGLHLGATLKDFLPKEQLEI